MNKTQVSNFMKYSIFTAFIAVSLSLFSNIAFAQTETKVLASDGAAEDQFGQSIDIDGNFAVVGAYFDDDNGTDSGSAYIFQWDGVTWNEIQKITASDGAAEDQFGFSVAISGNFIIVGAAKDDDNGTDSGSAYIFQWDGVTWNEIQKITPSDGAGGYQFGYSVAINGSTLVASSPFHTSNGASSGSAYIFRWNSTSWIEEQQVFGNDTAADDRFGHSVSIEEDPLNGDIAVVSAYRNNFIDTNAGSIYVFRWNSTSWIEEQQINASDAQAEDRLGYSVSISNDRIVAGAIFDDDTASNSGSAYVFEWDGVSSWNEIQKITASDAAENDWFGFFVDIDDDLIIVGTYLDNNANGADAGSAYLYQWDGATWNQNAKLLSSDGTASDWFGRAVAVSDTRAFIGTKLDDDNGNNSGSAYFYELTNLDFDGDGESIDSGDCDDTDPLINTSAVEVCDGVDNNCDGNIDESVTTTYYLDSDTDTYGDVNSSTEACSAPLGYVTDNTDCDDSNAAINPGATEVCDGVDNDCDGGIDVGLTTTYYQDNDGDTYGNAAVSLEACSAPSGYVTDATDCDDTNIAINPGAVEINDDGIDQDCSGADTVTCYDDIDGDGFGDPLSSSLDVDGDCTDDPNQSPFNTDCDDSNAGINPNATEIPDNGVDEDCSGADTVTCFQDLDNDTYGSSTTLLAADGNCTDTGESSVSGDCDDGNPNINPGITEIPDDGIDQDCSGTDSVTCFQDLDGDTYGSSNTLISTDDDCTDSGESTLSTDCDDSNPSINPGITEIPDDGIDNDCSGADTVTCFEDNDGDGYGSSTTLLATDGDCTDSGESSVDTDCNDNDAGINPGVTEIPGDGIDQNCDGNDTVFCFEDLDGDGFGSTNSFAAPDGDCDDPGESTVNTDCNDGDAAINPSATEIPDDGIDQDCDGTDTVTCFEDLDGDNFGSSTTLLSADGNCTSSGESAVTGDCDDSNIAVNPSAIEICDGIDNDCDGSIDTGLTTTYYQDQDGDGFGDTNVSVDVCSAPAGYVANNTDCDDNDANSFPGGTEIPDDGIDQDCSGTDTVTCFEDLDGDTYGSSVTLLAADGDCTDSGESLLDTDCDDNDPNVNPGVAEICSDTIDNNCDGNVNEDFDQDGDGFSTCDNDCNDSDAAINPDATEICDTVDNNCNGSIDEGFDLDGDGFTTCAGDCDDSEASAYPGAVENLPQQCGDGIDQDCDGSDLSCDDVDFDGDGFTINTGDCNEKDAAIYPGALETCDMTDNNCDGAVDEGFDVDGDGFTTCGGDCQDNDAAIYPGAQEICEDKFDNNCDGEVNEGCGATEYDESRVGYLSVLNGYKLNFGRNERQAWTMSAFRTGFTNNQREITSNDENGINVRLGATSNVKMKGHHFPNSRKDYQWRNVGYAAAYDNRTMRAISNPDYDFDMTGTGNISQTKDIPIADLGVDRLSGNPEDLKFAVIIRSVEMKTTNGEGNGAKDLRADVKFIDRNGDRVYTTTYENLRSQNTLRVQGYCKFRGPNVEREANCKLKVYIVAMNADWGMRSFNWGSSNAQNGPDYNEDNRKFFTKTQVVSTEAGLSQDNMFLALNGTGYTSGQNSTLEIDQIWQRAKISRVAENGDATVDMRGVMYGYAGTETWMPSHKLKPNRIRGLVIYCKNDNCRTTPGETANNNYTDQNDSSSMNQTMRFQEVRGLKPENDN